MIEYMELGSSPSDEDCVQVSDGNRNYISEMESELWKYKTMLENIFPQYKELGCRFKLKWGWWDSTHQYGEVVIFYNPDILEQDEFVYFVEENLPDKWNDLEVRSFVSLPRIPKCDQCDSADINGIYCHEKGCPNFDKVWEHGLEMWIDKEYEGMGDGLNDGFDLDMTEEIQDMADDWEKE